MAIKVQCACGKAFAAKDELAGKSVKCPGCQKPLKIPGGTAPAKAPAKPKAEAPAKPEKPAPVSTASDLFDEAGMRAAEKGTIPCPGCAEPLAQDAVICIKCGFNLKLGRKMQTMKVGSESEVHTGHGNVAQGLMDRAAETLDGDIEAEATRTTEGLPWWFYLVVLIILIGIAAFMLNRSGGGEESKDGKKASLESSQTMQQYA